MEKKFRYIVLALLLAVSFQSFGQETRKERNLIKKGNEYYEAKKYAEAEECYNKALKENPNSPIAKFNLATTLLRSRKNDNSKQDSILYMHANSLLDKVAKNPAASDALREKAYFNLGRSAYDREDYQSSVDSFTDALRINPKDDEARKNLRMAQKKLSQGGQNNNDKKNEQQKEQDKQNQNNGKDKQNPPQNNEPQQPQNPPQQKRDTNAEQLLNAVQNEEKNTRDKVNKRKEELMQGRPRSRKPW